MKPKTRTVLTITLSWTLLAILLFLYAHYYLAVTLPPDQAYGSYYPKANFIGYVFSSLLGGMSLDVTSSTTIAERMGHTLCFEFIKEFIADVTDPIIDNKGEVYQYVGDEVVVSWKVGNSKANANCVRCFLPSRATSPAWRRNTKRGLA